MPNYLYNLAALRLNRRSQGRDTMKSRFAGDVHAAGPALPPARM
jgi:hypothetical protein